MQPPATRRLSASSGKSSRPKFRSRPGFEPEPWDDQWSSIRKSLDDGSVYVTEDGEDLVAVVHVLAPDRGVSHVEWAYVREGSRRRGVVTSLLRECVREARENGAITISLEALKTNEPALTVWQRLGFEVVEFFMATPLDVLELRLAEVPSGASHASTHVQSDDRLSVERAVAQFVPRLGFGGGNGGSQRLDADRRRAPRRRP